MENQHSKLYRLMSAGLDLPIVLANKNLMTLVGLNVYASIIDGWP